MNSALRLLFAAGVLVSTAVVVQARIERVVEKSFTVAGSGTLNVESHGGSIEVRPAADGVVHVKAKQKIRASSEAEADELLQKLELTMSQSGNDVRVYSKYEKRPIGFSFGSWPPVQVDLVITVPAGYATELRTSGGSLLLGDLAGRAQLHTSGGSIKLGNMGSTVDAHTSGGSISLASAKGEVKLDTSGGSITSGPVEGPAALSTSGGSIRIDAVAGALKAHTSGGSIRATINGPLKDDCSLDTSGGSVRVDVDKTAAFRLDASTSGGSVNADGLTLTLQNANTNRSKLAGMVNGGGPLLKLRSSGGGIIVRAN